MSSLNDSKFLHPKSYEAFEDLIVDYASIKLGGHTTKNGRTGQAQKGVDVLTIDLAGEVIGFQCKNYSKLLPLEEIQAEITKAESFCPPLHHFFIATTSPRDSVLQEKVNKIKVDRIRNNKFPVDLLYWDDIIRVVQSDSAALKRNFPYLFELNSTSNAEAIERDILLLKSLFSKVEFDSFHSYIDGAPKYVNGRFIVAPDYFGEIISSPTFLISNKEVHSKIIDFFGTWQHLVLAMSPLKGCYAYNDSSYPRLVYNMQKGSEVQFNEFKNDFDYLRTLSYQIASDIMTYYTSIDLNALSVKARKDFYNIEL